MALELLKSMSKWYPHEYFEPEKKSVFRQMYMKLVDKGVVFPEEKDFAYIKEKDFIRFN